MIHFNIAWRAICMVAMVSVTAGIASAQSVLNFTSRSVSGIGITNTALYPADVKFTLYNADGTLATAGVVNPVNGRVPARGQISVSRPVVFRGSKGDTWVQVSSPVNGLDGFYFNGDSTGSVDPELATQLTVQTIPFVPSNPRSTNSLILTNPSAQVTAVRVVFYDVNGAVMKSVTSQLAAHAQAILQGMGGSARITSDVAILANVVQDSGNSPISINGQGTRSRGQRLVAPYFKNDEGTTSLLVLSSSDVSTSARVSFFTNSGTQPAYTTVALPANGSAWIDRQRIAGGNTSDEGWLLIEAATPVSGLVLVTSQNSRSALPLQSAPLDRTLFSRFIDGGDFTSSLNLVGTAERDAVVTVTLSRPDGTTVARNEVPVPPLWRVAGKIRELVPVPDGFSKGFITIDSTAPVYALEFIEANGNAAEAGLGPRRLARVFQAGPMAGLPRIAKVDIIDSPEGVRRLKLTGENFGSNPTVSIGGRTVPLTPIAAADGEFLADVPPLEPGFINVKVRAAGLESEVYPLGPYPDEIEFIPRRGHALFQKLEVTDNGLDPTRTVMVPIRNARVEVVDRATREIVSVAETNEQGEFVAAVPDRPGLIIQVLSRLRSADVKVLDNMNGNRPYAISKDIDDPQDLSDIEMVDTSRVSGAFNILDAIQRGNALLAQADPQLIPPPLTIYWSEKNSEAVLLRLTSGFMRSTFFNPGTNTAYVSGDRSVDSDEFDDSVILHEYAHLLAVRFSRDDSPGGPHFLGEMLDARLAWSEGWANFFSSAARGTPIYLDSKASGIGVRFDLEENVPAGDRQTYRSETAVHGLLWDLFDDNADPGDSVQLPFSSIWKAFTELRNDRFVYLPHFLERLLAQNPSLSEPLRAMVVLRNIDFQPDVRPSVNNGFPIPIAIGEIQKGEVDSFTSKRRNLANSAHFYRFTTTGGQAFIRLDIDGLGPANNPYANDLDLFLLDAKGGTLVQSNRGIGPEIIPWINLAPGTYYLEIRSYSRTETNNTVFNSGHYQLSVQIAP